jgi:hypothetical protein
MLSAQQTAYETLVDAKTTISNFWLTNEKRLYYACGRIL